MQVYYAQKRYYTLHGRWAVSIAELAIGQPADIAMRVTPDGFDAFGDSVTMDGAAVRWHVRHDSLLWRSAIPAERG